MQSRRLLAPLFGIAGTYLIIIALFAVSVSAACRQVRVCIDFYTAAEGLPLQRPDGTASIRHCLMKPDSSAGLRLKRPGMARTDSAGGAEELDDFEDIDDLEIDGIATGSRRCFKYRFAGRQKKEAAQKDGWKRGDDRTADRLWKAFIPAWI